MNVLIACEESQRVCLAFRRKGANAFSCDIQECSGGHPEYHVVGDCRELFKESDLTFTTSDGQEHHIDKWDLIISHPPCTYFTKAGARHLYKNGKIDPDRYNKMLDMKELFYSCLHAPADYICVENPTPMKIVGLPPQTQVIQPYEYGHNFSKRTLLWLKNLPELKPTDIQEFYISMMCFAHDPKERSKTFTGIANAMAEQWYNYINN